MAVAEADTHVDDGENGARTDQQEVYPVMMQERDKFELVSSEHVSSMGLEDGRHGPACHEVATAMMHDLVEISISFCRKTHHQSLLRAA